MKRVTMHGMKMAWLLIVACVLLLPAGSAITLNSGANLAITSKEPGYTHVPAKCNWFGGVSARAEASSLDALYTLHVDMALESKGADGSLSTVFADRGDSSGLIGPDDVYKFSGGLSGSIPVGAVMKARSLASGNSQTDHPIPHQSTDAVPCTNEEELRDTVDCLRADDTGGEPLDCFPL